jgi:hypothetical protein
MNCFINGLINHDDAEFLSWLFSLIAMRRQLKDGVQALPASYARYCQQASKACTPD